MCPCLWECDTLSLCVCVNVQPLHSCPDIFSQVADQQADQPPQTRVPDKLTTHQRAHTHETRSCARSTLDSLSSFFSTLTARPVPKSGRPASSLYKCCEALLVTICFCLCASRLLGCFQSCSRFFCMSTPLLLSLARGWGPAGTLQEHGTSQGRLRDPPSCPTPLRVKRAPGQTLPLRASPGPLRHFPGLWL